jgi:cobalt-zinc-cadmium efflux system protein
MARDEHQHDATSEAHSHVHAHAHGLSSNLRVAFALNLAFTFIEIFGGLWTNSIAILSDALHDAGDCLTLGLALYLQRVSARNADARFTYGYRRFSSLGALISGVLLSVGVGYMGWQAVHRLGNPEPVHASGMMMLAIVGVVFNGLAAWKLRHSHSLNEKVAGWHLMEDTLGWIAVLIGSGIMSVWDLPIIDPLLSLGISLFILWNVIRNLRQVAHVFLQRAPAGFDVGAFERRLCTFPGVLNAHHTQTWTVDGEHHVLSTHLVLQPGSTRDQIVEAKRQVHRLLKEQDFEHITVDVELDGEICTADSCE